MDLVFKICIFILVLSFLVVIHELGHLLMAKLFKVRVEEFGLGYPPRAKKLFSWAGTVFSLNWIPFGGFVKLEGEDGPEKSTSVVKTKNGLAPFYAKPAYARLAIILAGAAVNFLFGIFAFATYFSATGIPTLVPQARIGFIADNSPAAAARIPVEVTITAIRIKESMTQIHDSSEVIALVSEHGGEKVTLITTGHCDGVQCDPKQQQFEVYIRKKNEVPPEQGAIGIGFENVVVPKFYPWYEMPWRAAWYGVEQAAFLVVYTITQLSEMIVGITHGVASQGVSGPVGIFQQANDAGFFSKVFLVILNLSGLISVILAIINFL